MFGNELESNEYYKNGIPTDITECTQCHKPIDIENKSQYHLPWCTDCRNKYLRNVEFEHNKR